MIERATVHPLVSPAIVPITMPSTSPIAQPVRQCSVACRAAAHGTADRLSPDGCVTCSGCWCTASPSSFIPPGGTRTLSTPSASAGQAAGGGVQVLTGAQRVIPRKGGPGLRFGAVPAVDHYVHHEG